MALNPRPRFTVVSAVYNVAPYLPDFIASIEAQTRPLDDVEIIMVDDGSTDDSPRLLAEWAMRRPETVQVLTQTNAGQGEARNAGIDAARGEWITFPDPDDVLERRYLEVVDHFLTEHPDADLVATQRLIWNEATGQVANVHPLRYMFQGDPFVDLTINPERFHGSSPASFFLLDRVREQGVRFDGRVRPNFEDGHFNVRYLLGHSPPRVGFLDSARYRYRKRADNSSTLQSAADQVGRYSDVLEHGYLDVVCRADEQYGEVPNWLASFIVYELHWYFISTDSKARAGRPASGNVADRFHELVAEILRRMDVEAVLPYAPPSLRPVTKTVLAHGYERARWHEPNVLLSDLDMPQQLVKATYLFTGDLPEEVWYANGQAMTPLHQKIRDLEFYGRPLVRQRVVWLPANQTQQVSLDGQKMDIVYEPPRGPVKVAPPGQIRYWLNPESDLGHRRVPEHLRRRRPESTKGKLAQRLANQTKVRARYADAWVLMDRVHDANDSGEILFRHLRENHPEINAWFVLEKGTPDWDRFRAAGHADRLVAYDSVQWRLLMANAKHLLSSHADAAIVAPKQIEEFTHTQWRFHFLQHGVIKDDLSAWLDPKKMDTFVVSTRQEQASIAGDHSPYVFTTREVALTGLPRFDRIREVGLRFPPDKRDLLLVTPTWRNGLMPPIIEGTQRRELDPSLLNSYFVRSWLGYLTDPKLAEACREHGVKLGFLPHPNLQPLVPLMDLPEHVVPLTYEGGDPQELFARARVFVTDFSSVAFNAAFLERPVVYYHFDADTVFGGGHVGRAGYFDYRRDGFGPVTESQRAAVDATLEALEHGPAPSPRYQARIDANFTERDGRCCERVVKHVLETERNRSALPPVLPPRAP